MRIIRVLNDFSNKRSTIAALFVTAFLIAAQFPYTVQTGAVISWGDFNFGAAGDWAAGTNTKNTANNMANHQVELALGLGDYAYTTGTTAVNSWWNNLMTPLHGKFKGALGNHDVGDQAAYASVFGQTNGWYYSFDYQNVHYVVMNSEQTYSVGSPQYNFVKGDLATASASSSINWIVVTFHRPLYTSPTTHPGESALRDAYQPLFDLYNVDLVLEGHNHNYQRSYPLKYNSANPSSPTITTTEKTSYTDPAGEIYVIVGTGGQGLYSLGGQSSFTITQFADTYGYLNVDVVNNGLTLKGTYYANDGAIKDAFAITKSGSGSPPPTNTAPIANAGPDQTVNEGAQVALTGAGSSDPDGNSITYSWSQTGGPTVSLNSVHTVAASFAAPQVTTDTILSFQLTVNDGSLSSSPDTVKVTVKDTSTTPPPPTDTTTNLGVFYYPWMGGKDGGANTYRYWRDYHSSVPKTWDSNYLPDINPAAFDPANELYDVNDPAIVKKQLGWMNKAGIDFVISSWWGQNHYTDTALNNIFTNVLPASDNPYPGVKFTIYYEKAGFPSQYDLSEASLVADINYIKSKYGDSPYFLKVDGKPVIFVYNTGSLAEAQKWKNVRDQTGIYLVLKVFSGYNDNLSLADSWHQYAPTMRYEAQGTHSAFVSPGWNPIPELSSSRQLAREDWAAWDTAVGQLASANVKWKLVETWNEWGEGTGIEPAQKINHDDVNGFTSAADSYGEKYLDTLAKYFKTSTSPPPDPNPPPSGKYSYAPSFAATGDTYYDTASSKSLKLETFSLSSWFKTSSVYSYRGFIVDKGGLGLEGAGFNLNYGIWMNKNEQIQAGFETYTGKDHYVNTQQKYNDGKWHHAVVTYDGKVIILYVDGVRVADKPVTETPDNTGDQPLRVGANSQTKFGFFTGSIDEVTVWNRAISAKEVVDAYSTGNLSANGEVLTLPFAS